MKRIEFEGCLDCPFKDEYRSPGRTPEIQCNHPDREGHGWSNVIGPESLWKTTEILGSPDWCPIEDV